MAEHQETEVRALAAIAAVLVVASSRMAKTAKHIATHHLVAKATSTVAEEAIPTRATAETMPAVASAAVVLVN